VPEELLTRQTDYLLIPGQQTITPNTIEHSWTLRRASRECNSRPGRTPAGPNTQALVPSMGSIGDG